jgi:hypothetical protein
MRSLLDGRPFADAHPSAVLRRLGICINDGPWWASDEERTAALMPLALDDRLCASSCVVSADAEAERARLGAAWARSIATPSALRSAAAALRSARIEKHPEALERHAVSLESAATTAADAATAATDAATAAAWRLADAAATDAAAAAAATADATDAATAADAAVVAATVAAADAWRAADAERRRLRDSLIDLFRACLAVGHEVANG